MNYQIPKNERDFIYKKLEKAIASGLSHADAEWKMKSFEILYSYCCRHEYVTANEITPILKDINEKTHDNRAIGGIFISAVSMGWITKCERKVPSKNGHLSMIQLWKSLIYQNL